MTLLATLTADLLFTPSQSPTSPTSGYDRFGGWTAIRGKKTGFYHVKNIGGKWWLVTPDGAVFFSKGVCHVSFEGDYSPALGFSPYKRAVTSKYGSAQAWARAAAERLKSWGLNTVGAWTDPTLYTHGLSYTVNLDLAASTGGDTWLRGGFPDVFDPDFVNSVDRNAARQCAIRKNDPWLLGYFTDNELRWGPDWRSKDSLLETFMKMREGSPGRTRVDQFLAERGCMDGTPTEADKAAFLELVAREYFKTCSTAIRKADPNHLILGCRFAGYAPDPVLKALRESVDLVSYNDYSHAAPTERLKHIAEVTGKPVMVTEFSFRAMDSGLPNKKGAGIPVATQQDRADLFEKYVTAIAKLPECVGYHWFEYADEPKAGRFDGENSDYGLVKIDDTPWSTLVGKLKAINGSLESVRVRAPAIPPH